MQLFLQKRESKAISQSKSTTLQDLTRKVFSRKSLEINTKAMQVNSYFSQNTVCGENLGVSIRKSSVGLKTKNKYIKKS